MKYGNINPFPIDYAFLPRLRGRLTLRRLTLRRKPWTSGEGFFTPFIVTHVSIRTSDTSSKPHSSPSTAYRTLSYHRNKLRSAASVYSLAPLNLPRKPTRPVSYYALFKGMAASKPTSWLSMPFHIVSHLTIILGP